MRKLLLASALLAAAAYGVLTAYRQPGPLTHPADVVVPRGAFAGVAQALRAAGVVDHAWELRGFEAASRWLGPVKAGEFAFPAGASVEQVLAVLRRGRPVQHLVTVPEGVTAARVARLVAGARGLGGAVAVPEEGGFLPESYAYQLGDSADAVLARGRAAMAETVARVWSGRAAGLALRSRKNWWFWRAWWSGRRICRPSVPWLPRYF